MQQRLLGVAAALAASLALLAGCGQQKITTTKKNYTADGMVAVIKGKAPHDAQLTAEIDGKTKKITNHDGNFVYTVAPTTKVQTVALKSGTAKRDVTVAASKGFGTYQAFAAKYNMILLQMNSKGKTTAKSGTAASSQQKQGAASGSQGQQSGATTTAAGAAAAKKAQAAMQAQLLAQAAKQPGALPVNGQEGIHNILTVKDSTVRTNVQNGQLIGATFITPTATLKSKTKAAAFAQQFALLASTLGADAKAVMKDFQKQAKDSQNGQTTMKTITSNKVHFDVGYSPDKLYIYITK